MFASLVVERAAAALVRPIDKAAAKMGLHPHEWRVLLLLSEHPDGLTINALASACSQTASAMSRRLDTMEHETLIERHHSNADRREVIVRLDTRGAVMASEIEQKAKAICDDLVDPTVLAALTKIAQSLPANEPAPLPRIRR